MKSRAAVAFEAKKPLEIVEVDLEGPQEGEVLVEIKATGICHTDEFTISGADPEGLFPAIMGHEGAGVVVEVGPGVTSLEEGRPCHSALHAGMPRMRILPQSQDQSLPEDPHHPGQGPDARRHLPLLLQGQDGAPLHGLLDLLELHRAARDRPGQGAQRRALRQDLLHRLRRHHRHRRGHQHGQGRSRAPTAVVFGLGGIGLNVIQGLRLAGRQHDRRRRPQHGARGLGQALRHDAFRQSERRSRAISSPISSN